MPPWCASGAEHDSDTLRVAISCLEITRGGLDLLDSVAREKRLPPFDTLQMEIDMPGLTSREQPLRTEQARVEFFSFARSHRIEPPAGVAAVSLSMALLTR